MLLLLLVCRPHVLEQDGELFSFLFIAPPQATLPVESVGGRTEKHAARQILNQCAFAFRFTSCKNFSPGFIQVQRYQQTPTGAAEQTWRPPKKSDVIKNARPRLYTVTAWRWDL